MKLVIYARYSSHSQTEQSIEGQLIACYDYAKTTGIRLWASILTEHKAVQRTTGSSFKE